MSRALKESHDLPGVMLDNCDEEPFMQIEKETFLQYFFLKFDSKTTVAYIVWLITLNATTAQRNKTNPPQSFFSTELFLAGK